MNAKRESIIVATFNSSDKFLAALETLLDNGIESDQISVLSDHEAIIDRFGRVPSADEMSDRPDTPRESMDARITIDHAIDFISETVAVLTEIGAATAAYAVGGPVGVATGASAATRLSVDELLSEHIDEDWREQLQQSVQDGGIICWVHAHSADDKAKAEAILHGAGGQHIHEPTGS
jgi:hypothetical protein